LKGAPTMGPNGRGGEGHSGENGESMKSTAAVREAIRGQGKKKLWGQ